MPNWVSNKLIISPDEDSDLVFDPEKIARALHLNPSPEPKDLAEKVIEALRDDSDDEQLLSFERLLPTPEHLLDGDGWFDWRLENWGTKWDASDVLFFEGDAAQKTMGNIRLPDKTLVYVFLTAWSPPAPWLKAISAEFPEAMFHMVYVEEQEFFYGLTMASDGKFVGNLDWKNDPDGKENLRDYGMIE